MNKTGAALLLIGDELLSGRTRDANLQHLAERLGQHGIALNEARLVSDDHDRIIAALRELSLQAEHVFTSGGIGPTHDDITAEAIAAAHGVAIGVREDARAILASHYAGRGLELNAARLRMARIPEGAELIDNPVSAAPGFSLQTALGRTHVLAGVPRIFQAMLDGLLPRLARGQVQAVARVSVHRGEGDVAEPLGRFAAAHPALAIGSYPFDRDGLHGTELVIRGFDAGEVEAARAALQALLGPDFL